jgi:hypothetical protein
MILIAQIILTILTWRKGWKWMSLLPVSIAIFIGLLFSSLPLSFEMIFIDILSVIALIIMYFNPPKKEA